MANIIQSSINKIKDFANKYVNTYQNVSKYVPFAPQVVTPQRTQQNFQNIVKPVNTFIQRSKQELYNPSPTFADFTKNIFGDTGKYIANRYINPLTNIAPSAKMTFGKNKTLGERGQGALGLLSGAATMFPDPVGDIALPAYDYLKGYSASFNKGGNLKQRLEAGKQSLIGEKQVGLGEAVTTNKIGSTILNTLEFPIMLGLLRKQPKKNILDSGDVKEAVNIYKRSLTNWIEGDKINIKQYQKDMNLVDEIFKNKYGATVKDLNRVSFPDKVKTLYRIATEDFRENREISVGQGTRELGKSPILTPKVKVVNGKVKVKMVEDEFIKGLERDKAKQKLPGIMYTTKKSEAEYIAPSEFKKAKNIARGVAETEPKTFEGLFSKWIGEKNAASTTAVDYGSKIKLPKGFDLKSWFSYVENKKGGSPEVKKTADLLKVETDKLFNLAKKSGIDLGYQKDYVPHIWKEDPAIVSQLYKTASKRFGFGGERAIPTYEEGLKMGLTPKFTDPRQLLAEYVRKLETTKANIEFINGLKNRGLIVQKRLPGFQPITGVGFQGPSIKVGENTIREGSYYAPPKVAKVINQVFSPNESPAWLQKAAGVSRIIQDVGLSGGVPRTPINAWTVAQMQKEILAGRIKGPFKSLWASLTEGGSKKYFTENSQFIKEQQLNNVPINTNNTISNLADRVGLSKFFNTDLDSFKASEGVKGNIKIFKDNFKKIWNASINEPTFQRFMPMLQTEFYKDAKNSALKAGKSEAEAINIASQATKNFYGLTSTAKQATQSKIGHDVITTLFFAPKYRESMVNFWVNNIKSLKNPLAIENRANAKFLVGSILAYLAYDKVNQFYTGKHMSENPPGKEDKALVPLGDGYTMGVPFLSSIATLPRTGYKIAKNIIGGNLPQAVKESKSFLSMGLRTPVDIATNEDYFGGQIYEPGSKDMAKDIYTYASGQYGHPYIREVSKYLQGKQPGYQTISKMLEMPLRFYKDSAIKAGYYYQSVDEAKKGLSPSDKAILDKWIAKKPTDMSYAQDTMFDMAEATEKLSRPDLLQREAQIKIQTAMKNGQSLDPFYTLTPDQQQVLLRLQTFYPGDKQKSDLQTANIDWLKPYWTARTAYFDELISKGTIKASEDRYSFKTSPEIQKKLDYYYSLPYGTGQRTAFVNQNPDLVQYWNAKTEDTNQKRSQLGLLPIESGFSSSGGFSKFSYKPKVKKVAKISVKKPRVAKIKMPKFKKLKVAKSKTPKIKIINRKSFAKIKTPKVKLPKFAV